MPLFRLRCRPHEKQPLDDFADGALLGNNEQPGARLPASQALTDVARHGAPVVGDQDAVLLRGKIEEGRIFGSS